MPSLKVIGFEEMRINNNNSALITRLRQGASDVSFHNPYIVKAKELTGLLYTLEELGDAFPGIFANPSLPVVLEIGCYLGATVTELAKFNPQINVLGIDLRYKRVVKSCKKIFREELSNCKIAICNAWELISILPHGSIFGAFIFFPDPWEKKKQQRNRLLNQHFLENFHNKLEAGGFFWLKTDKQDYFAEVIDTAKRCGYSISPALSEKIAQREYKSLFENMFINQGKTIYQSIFQKPES